MTLLKTQALIERARSTRPAALSVAVEPGIYGFSVKQAGESTSHRDGVYIELSLSQGDGGSAGTLRKVFRLGDRDETIAQRDMAEFLAFIACLGFIPEDAENLTAGALEHKTGYVGIELITPEHGTPFNVPGYAAWWPATTDPATIDWKPREDAPRKRTGFRR